MAPPYRPAPPSRTALSRAWPPPALDLRLHTTYAAAEGAKDAIREAQMESIKAAKDLRKAAGEARREAWRWFGGLVWFVASVGATGALLGALALFWLQERADANAFGKYPGIYCRSADGQVVPQNLLPATTTGRKPTLPPSVHQVPLHVLLTMQDADDFQPVPMIPEIDHMCPARIFQIAGAHVNHPAFLLTRRQHAAGITDFRDVAFGLRQTPPLEAVFPDAVNVGFCRRSEGQGFHQR